VSRGRPCTPYPPSTCRRLENTSLTL
jgi:hypothetical protein